MKSFVRKFSRILLPLAFSLFGLSTLGHSQTVNVIGHAKDGFGNPVPGGSATNGFKVCFQLVQSDGQIPAWPTIAGGAGGFVGLTKNNCVTPAADGSFSVNVLANDMVAVAGQTSTTMYSVTYTKGGSFVTGATYTLLSTDPQPENLDQKLPNIVTSLPPSPTNDSTYLRLIPQAPLSGPLTINGNLTAGPGTFSGAVTTQSVNGDPWVGLGAGQYASIPLCYAAAVSGQNCHVPQNWTDPTWTANLTMNKNNVGIQFHGCALVQQSTFQLIISDGVVGGFISGPQGAGIQPCLEWRYTGTGAGVVVGTSGGGSGAANWRFENVWFNSSNNNTNNTSIGFDSYGLGGSTFRNVLIGGNAIAERFNGNSATDGESMVWDHVHLGCLLANCSTSFIGFQANQGTAPNSIGQNMILDMQVIPTGVLNGSKAFEWNTSNEWRCFGCGGTNVSMVFRFMGATHGIYIVAKSVEAIASSPVDVVFDTNSTNNEVIVEDINPVAPVITDNSTAKTNMVRFSGNQCIWGCPGVSVFNDQTLGSAAASITVSNIPAWGKSLRIVFQGRSANAVTADTLVMQVNGDTGSNYDLQQLFGNNATATSASSLARTNAIVGAPPGTSATRANTAGISVIEIPNYAGTTFEKQILFNGGVVDSTAANNFTLDYMNSWRNTAAITSIKIFISGGGNLTAGTRVTTYIVN